MGAGYGAFCSEKNARLELNNWESTGTLREGSARMILSEVSLSHGKDFSFGFDFECRIDLSLSLSFARV